MKYFGTILIASCVFAIFVQAEEPPPLQYGHSVHGEAFNEGPRQAARLMDGMPEIDFPVTTSNKTAQAFFNQGVAQLHGFWYLEAERTFRQVLALDEKCVMAFWGITMANVDNSERAAKLIKDVDKKIDGLSEREKLYIKGLADFYRDPKKDEKKRRRDLVRAYEKIVQQFPEDLEAKAFLLFQVWHNNNRGKMDIGSHQAMSALADQVLAVNPAHPLHHYRIHLWDYENREQALDAAAKCGPAGAGIAHMWHMPGHIYSGLKRYADAAWQQEASARVDHAHMIRDRLMPDQIHNYAHNNGWLIDNLSHVGRVRDAVDLACNMIELPRLPRFKEDGSWKAERSGFAGGQQRLMKNLIQFELWSDIIELDTKGYFFAVGNDDAAMRRHHGLALAYFHQKQAEQGGEQLRKLRAYVGKMRRLRIEAADAAEAAAKQDKKKPEEVTAAMAKALQDGSKGVNKVKDLVAEVELVRDLHRKKQPEGLVARVESAKGVNKLRKAQWMARLGDWEKAVKMAEEAVKSGKNQVLPLAVQAHILHRADKKEASVAALNALRDVSSFFDLELPAVKRVTPLAHAQGWPKDWRKAYEPAKDLGERPPLDSLGPFRWSPYTAPSWSMTSEAGKTVKLEDYRGKPMVLIYYLGSGCKHCIEQLDAFAKIAARYERNGIPIVAVSRESAADLHKTRESVADEDWFPFTVLSDEAMKHFKAYRAYDDFEDVALHGTFLIDAEGRVRWQDIGFEPMMHPAFLLEEAQRLLAF